MIEDLKGIVGEAHVLTGADMGKYSHDWTHRYISPPLAVLRPGSTELFVMGEHEVHGARGLEALPHQRGHGLVQRHQTALVVDGATAPDVAVADETRERRVGPS